MDNGRVRAYVFHRGLGHSRTTTVSMMLRTSGNSLTPTNNFGGVVVRHGAVGGYPGPYIFLGTVSNNCFCGGAVRPTA